MSWTREKPTEPGLYWYRTASRGQMEIDTVNVDFFNFGDGAVLAADIEAEIFPVATLSGEWKEVLHQYTARTTSGWTKEKPSREGYYWYKDASAFPDRTRILELIHRTYSHESQLEAYYPGISDPVPLLELKGGYWLGPIEIPEGPQE